MSDEMFTEVFIPAFKKYLKIELRVARYYIIIFIREYRTFSLIFLCTSFFLPLNLTEQTLLLNNWKYNMQCHCRSVWINRNLG